MKITNELLGNLSIPLITNKSFIPSPFGENPSGILKSLQLFTVIVKVVLSPSHPLSEGETVMFAVIELVPELIAEKELISPVPFDASPIEVLSFVQVYVVPDDAPLKMMVLVGALLHNDWLGTVSMVCPGVTMMIKLWVDPGQPLVEGVTSILAVSATVLLFIAVNELISPLPFAGKPVEILSFVQL